MNGCRSNIGYLGTSCMQFSRDSERLLSNGIMTARSLVGVYFSSKTSPLTLKFLAIFYQGLRDTVLELDCCVYFYCDFREDVMPCTSWLADYFTFVTDRRYMVA